jgi:iron-sulfur cluster repair protein YtfE (RIC family)
MTSFPLHTLPLSREQIARMPLAELTLDYPSLKPVLDELGLDTCCGGHFTPAEAAQEHGLSAEVVLDALARAATATASGDEEG